MMLRLPTTLAGMLAIVLAATILGYTFPAGDSSAVGSEVYTWPTAAPTPTPEPISLSEVKDKLDRKERVVLVDARSKEDYESGHIAGAVSLPFSQFEERFPLVRDRLPTDAELIVYCSGDGCGLSTRLSEALISRGYTRVRVFSAGWPAWLSAGNPIESGGT